MAIASQFPVELFASEQNEPKQQKRLVVAGQLSVALEHDWQQAANEARAAKDLPPAKPRPVQSGTVAAHIRRRAQSGRLGNTEKRVLDDPPAHLPIAGDASGDAYMRYARAPVDLGSEVLVPRDIEHSKQYAGLLIVPAVDMESHRIRNRDDGLTSCAALCMRESLETAPDLLPPMKRERPKKVATVPERKRRRERADEAVEVDMCSDDEMSAGPEPDGETLSEHDTETEESEDESFVAEQSDPASPVGQAQENQLISNAGSSDEESVVLVSDSDEEIALEQEMDPDSDEETVPDQQSGSGSDEEDASEQVEISDCDEQTVSEQDEEPQEKTLREKHPVPEHDGRVVLYESGNVTLDDGRIIKAAHTYVINNNCLDTISGTTFLGKFFSPFDGDAMARSTTSSNYWTNHKHYRDASERTRIAIRDLWFDSIGQLESDPLRKRVIESYFSGQTDWQTAKPILAGDEYDEIVALIQEDIDEQQIEALKQIWIEARDAGTAMHEKIEFFFKGTYSRADLERFVAAGETELAQFLCWYDEVVTVRGWIPYRMELFIHLPHNGKYVCGAIDALFLNPKTGKLINVDWKRAGNIYMTARDKSQKAKAPLNELNDCNYYKYLMQQSLYAYILETTTNLTIEESYLLVCHPLQKKYNFIKLELRRDLVVAALNSQ